MAKIIHIKESELKETVQAAVKHEVNSIMASSRPVPQRRPLNEMARLNLKDNGKLFPFNAFEVSVYSNEQDPPHIHVKSKQEGYDVRISIADGELVSVERYGARGKTDSFSDVTKMVKLWFNQPSNIPGFSGKTNQEVASGVWLAMNG